ncbi:MAG: polysaccharide deacetylase family protein [Pirellulales bacterium]
MRWKSALLSAYYHSSIPWRQARLRQLCEEGRAPAMVLFYHRVADQHPNGWTISRQEFAEQIRWIGENFRWASLDQIVDSVRSGRAAEPLVHVTFDDGYADNMDYALPLLRDWQVPYTYFVATDHVFEGQAFAHDCRQGIPLRPNSPEDLRTIVDWGGEIGAHTQSHCDLGVESSIEKLRHEIAGSRQRLQEWLGQEIRYFAFPYGQFGNMSAAAFRIAREAGFRACCSAYGGYNFPGEDPFHIQRIHGDPQLPLVRNWLTLDPRKLNRTPRYEYGAPDGQ